MQIEYRKADNSTLSEEYLKLYKAGMKADDLEVIRQNGLNGGK